MSVLDSFATLVASLTGSTLGQTLFIGQAPSSNRVADSIWWIRENGGNVLTKNQTGEQTKSYQIEVFYRNRDYQATKDALYALEEDLNCDGCSQLAGFDTIDIEATTFPVDNDLDDEDRKLGLLQATIEVYKEC